MLMNLRSIWRKILIVQKLLADAGEDKDLSRVESAGVADDKDGAVNHLPRWRIVMMVSAAAFFLVLTTIIVWLTIVTEQYFFPTFPVWFSCLFYIW